MKYISALLSSFEEDAKNLVMVPPCHLIKEWEKRYSFKKLLFEFDFLEHDSRQKLVEEWLEEKFKLFESGVTFESSDAIAGLIIILHKIDYFLCHEIASALIESEASEITRVRVVAKKLLNIT